MPPQITEMLTVVVVNLGGDLILLIIKLQFFPPFRMGVRTQKLTPRIVSNQDGGATERRETNYGV
jgi:hypothetical protein